MENIGHDFYEKYGLEWRHTERYEWEHMSTSYKVSNFISIIDDLKPNRILDFGCGLGDALSLLAKHFHSESAVGIDISSTMIEYARKQYPEHTFVVGSIERLKDFRVDLITFFDVLEHIEDIQQVLEIAGTIAEYVGIGIPLEKTFYISLLNTLHLKEKKSRLYLLEGHVHEFNRSDFEAILEAAHLKVVKAKNVFPTKEIQFSPYMKNRIKNKSGMLSRQKYWLYIVLSFLPYWLTRHLFQIGAGTDLYVLCKRKTT